MDEIDMRFLSTVSSYGAGVVFGDRSQPGRMLRDARAACCVSGMPDAAAAGSTGAMRKQRMLTMEKLESYGANPEAGVARCMNMEAFY